MKLMYINEIERGEIYMGDKSTKLKGIEPKVGKFNI